MVDNIPRHIRLDYEELNINVFTGSLGIKELTIDIFDRYTLEPRGSVVIESLRMKGLSYWKYFVNNDMEWDEVLITSPHIAYSPSKTPLRTGLQKKTAQSLTCRGLFTTLGPTKGKTPGYREGRIEAELNATKSFFNYLWLNLRSEITNTLTGDGKKDQKLIHTLIPCIKCNEQRKGYNTEAIPCAGNHCYCPGNFTFVPAPDCKKLCK